MYFQLYTLCSVNGLKPCEGSFLLLTSSCLFSQSSKAPVNYTSAPGFICTHSKWQYTFCRGGILLSGAMHPAFCESATLLTFRPFVFDRIRVFTIHFFLIYFPTWYSCPFLSNITILIYDIFFANPTARRAQSSPPCPQNRASQRRRTMYQSPFLPSRARIRVMASACPSPAPAGIPWARRVTRQSNADNCSAR